MFLLPILIPALNSSSPAFLFLKNFIHLFIFVRARSLLYEGFFPAVVSGVFFSSMASGGFSLVVVQGLLIVVASLVAEHGLLSLQASVALGLSSCGTWA